MKRFLLLCCFCVPLFIATPASAEEGGMFDFNLGGSVGTAYIGDVPYLSLAFDVDVQLWAFQFAMQGAFNLDMEEWELRAEDWDENRDYMRIFECARFDLGWEFDEGSDDYFRVTSQDYPILREHGTCAAWPISQRGRFISARITALENITLGTGHVMHEFNNFLDVDHYTLGVLGEFQSNVTIGGTAIVADITRGDVMGGRVYYRPLWDHTEDEVGDTTLHELELGLTFVTDIGAPTEAATAFGGARIVDHERNLIYHTEEVMVLGVDLHYRFELRDEWFLGANGEWAFVYDNGTEWSQQIGNQGGHFSFGLFWEPPADPWTLDIQVEYRLVGSSYIPNYFDSFYMVQRAQYVLAPSNSSTIDPTLTKLGYMRDLAETNGAFVEHSYNALLHLDFWHWYTNDEGQRRLKRFIRAYLWVDHIVGREDSGTWGVLLLSPNLFDHLTLSGMYMRSGFNDYSDFFSLDGSLMRFTARYDRLWRGLYAEAVYYYRFRLDEETGYYMGAHDFIFNVGWDHDIL